MGKASEFDRHMEGRFAKPGELWPVRPEVKVRSDAPSIEGGDSTTIGSVLDRLSDEKAGIVIRAEDGVARAVVLSAERYAELAGCEIESEDRFRATLNHTIEPDPDALQELLIEQVDPAVEWRSGSRIWREPDQS